jgi:clan AA aspartic protease (TIGR02281 family)
MRLGWISLVVALSFAGAASAGEDPFAPLPANAAPLEQLIRRAAFGEAGADAALERWLMDHPQASTEEKRRGWRQLCKDDSVRTFYPQAALSCAAEKANGGDGGSGIPAALVDVPPIRAVGSARVRLVWNRIGSQDTDVTVKGLTLPWLVDTGAEISVVAQSEAERMGVRPVKGRFEVGTTTASVNGQIGMIDRLRIGGATVENVPVLVLPDAQLTIGGMTKIRAILGLQVLRAFHRVAWLRDAYVLALGEAAPPVKDSRYRLYWHGSGLGLSLTTQTATMGALLDTGSNDTFLWAPGVGLLTPEERASAAKKKSQVGGAGGVVTVEQDRFPRLTFEVAGVPVRLTDVELAGDKADGAGRVGMDVVSRFETMTLDFDRMAIAATPSHKPVVRR